MERAAPTQPGQPRVAGSGSVRGLERPRLDAPLCAPAPRRVRFADGGDQAVPAARFAHPRPPGARAHPRRGDHHRPPRPGPRQCGRHGPRRADARRTLQPAGPPSGGPSHLRLRGRRLPDGGNLARGVFPRGAPWGSASSSCSTTTTASRSTAGWTGGSRTTLRPGEAYGWRVVRAVDGHDPDRVEAAIAACRNGWRRGRRPPVPHLLPDHHRVGGAVQGPGRRVPTGRRSARTRWRRRARRWTGRIHPSRSRTTSRSGWMRARGEPPSKPNGAHAWRRTGRRTRTLAAEPRTASARNAAGRGGARRCGRGRGSGPRGRGRRDPPGVAARPRTLRPASSGAGRRIGRPHRLESHQVDRLARRFPRRAGRSYVYFGSASSGCSRSERHGPARRSAPLRRHVPRLLRLRA